MTPEQAVEICAQIDEEIDSELYALGPDDSPIGPQARLEGYKLPDKADAQGEKLLRQLQGCLKESLRAEGALKSGYASMQTLSDAVYPSEEALQAAIEKFEQTKAAVPGYSKTLADSCVLANRAVDDAAAGSARQGESLKAAYLEQAALCTTAAEVIRKRVPDVDAYVENCIMDGNSSEAASIFQDDAEALAGWAAGYDAQKKELEDKAQASEAASDGLWVEDAAGKPRLNPDNATARECRKTLDKIEALSRTQVGEFPSVPDKVKIVPPPPPAEPDLVIAATGDLPDSLLRPLLDGWARAQGSDGMTEENGMLVYSIPSSELGAEPGKFRVKVCRQDGEAAFEPLRKGTVDMLLTGRIVAGQTLKEWNDSLRGSHPALHGDENVSKRMAHVAYDALIFFGGLREFSNGLTLRDIISSRKLFCIGRHDSGRGEAAAVCGMASQEQDVVMDADESAVSTADFMSRSVSDDAICVGVYHSDINWLPNPDSAIASTVEGNLKELPQKLKRRVIAVRGNKNGDVITPPTRATISSGDYTYTYRINLFNTKESAAAYSLMEYVLCPDAQKIVENHNFVSSSVVGIGAMRLKNDVLPVEDVAARLGAEYGYGPKDTCLYGVRMPDKLSVHFDFKSVVLPPFAIHQDNPRVLSETAEEFLKVTAEVALVFVGHADCVYQGRVNYSNLSYTENRKLSEGRAVTVKGFYEAQQALAGKKLRMETVGASWLYPRRYIDKDKPLEQQQVSLADSRRVELFLILPKAVGEKLVGSEEPRQ